MKKDTNIKEEKLKPLSPTLRQKKRYLKIKIYCEHTFNFKELSHGLTKALTFYVGALDFSKEGVWILKEKFNEKEQTVVVKVSTKLKDKVVAATALIDKISDVECSLEVLRVGATLKVLEK